MKRTAKLRALKAIEQACGTGPLREDALLDIQVRHVLASLPPDSYIRGVGMRGTEAASRECHWAVHSRLGSHVPAWRTSPRVETAGRGRFEWDVRRAKLLGK